MTIQQVLATLALIGAGLGLLYAAGGSTWEPRGFIERILWGALCAIGVVLCIVVPTGAIVGLAWLVEVAAGY